MEWQFEILYDPRQPSGKNGKRSANALDVDGESEFCGCVYGRSRDQISINYCIAAF